jgi:hypothetical protein
MARSHPVSVDKQESCSWSAETSPAHGPSVAISGDEPVSVESTCDKIVISNQHELAYGGDDIGCGAIALTLAP